MSKVYMMVGLPGSGKSSWAARMTQQIHDLIIVNRDQILTMLRANYEYTLELGVIANEVIKVIIAGSGNYNLIIDETHLTQERRKRTIGLVRYLKEDADIIAIHCTESVNNLDYRMKDARGLRRAHWSKVIEGLKGSFEPIELGNEHIDRLVEVSLHTEDSKKTFKETVIL